MCGDTEVGAIAPVDCTKWGSLLNIYGHTVDVPSLIASLVGTFLSMQLFISRGWPVAGFFTVTKAKNLRNATWSLRIGLLCFNWIVAFALLILSAVTTQQSFWASALCVAAMNSRFPLNFQLKTA